MERLHREKCGVVVVASEGLRDKEGKPIVPLLFSSGRAEYFGDVGSYLAELVIRRLDIKARSEKPGLIGRTSICNRSETDIEEAIRAGREAVKAALAGKSGEMVGLFRKNTEGYEVEFRTIPIEKVMLYEKKMPEKYIDARGNDVTEEYTAWCRPLIGGKLPKMLVLGENIKGGKQQ